MPTRLEKPPYSYAVIDFHHMDYRTFYDLDTPEALVLAVISNPGAETHKAVLFRVFDKLRERISTEEKRVRECLHMIEVLTKDRGLNLDIQETYNMLDVHVEELPSYQIGFERGLKLGLERAAKAGAQRSAVHMVQSMLALNLPPEQVVTIMKISVEEVQKLASGEGL